MMKRFSILCTVILFTFVIGVILSGVMARVAEGSGIQSGISGPAGGDLGGNYPNPTVVNGSHITNSSIPNSGLVNVSTTVNGTPCTLGASCSVTASGSPSGAAGGDLGSTYPNPTVTNGSHITNSSIPNSGLVNPSTTVNGQTCTLGSTCTVTAVPSGSAGGDLSGTYPNPTVAKVNAVAYSAGPSNHSTPVITASNTATYKVIPDCTDTGGNHLNFTQSTDAYSCGTSGGATANQNIRAIGGGFDGGGSALTVGKVAYVTVPFACTIAGYNILVDTGTISFDVWKIATGTAIPTVANTIMTGGFLAISTGTALHSASVTLFTTTASSANDIYGFQVQAVSGATVANLVLQCNAT